MNGNNSNSLKRGAGAARLTLAKADIEIHLAQRDLDAAWLAGRQGITERHLRRLFENDGWSLSRYITARRLEWACRLLIDPGSGGTTIAAVAFETGFGDLSYFNRCFQKHFGVRPRDMRTAALAVPSPLRRGSPVQTVPSWLAGPVREAKTLVDA